MRNFTFKKISLFKLISFLVFFLFVNFDASAQFFTKHYIAPAPWQYFSKANEIVIATNSTSTVNIVLSKSDGTLVANLTAIKGSPAVYRFTGLPSAAPALALNTVLNAAGLIVTGTDAISINLRNVASDALGGDGSDQDIKGNAALTSFGDAGIGVKYRIGYYRDGSLGNFNNYGDQRPIYTIMAINNGTSIKLNGTVIATLNAGQSYLFKAAIGSLVESSNSTVMNTSAAIDTPNGCGDGAFNQIPPESVLGSEYFIERGKGNDTAEQTTVVATKPNTTLTINTFSATGALTATVNKTLVNAGDFYTFLNGISNTNFSASRVFATNNVAVYSGTAQSCEVDISTIAPVSECGGSNFIETAKFRNYGTGSLPYFGYVLLKDPSAAINVNGVNLESISGVNPRHQLGTTGWYIINFEDTQIGSPNVISVSSTAKMTISIVQQGGGFSMAGFFSNFAQIPEDPSLNYVSGGGCTNSSATLTTPAGFHPYQWYYNGTAITGATSNSYVASKTGSYSVSSTLSCGSVSQSKPVSVTLCTDLGVTKTVDVATPCVNSNVEFTVKVSNLGLNNATGVSLNDLLPSGYTYVSNVASTGTYNATSGVWSIGDLEPSAVVTLKVVATVNASGSYNNTASLPASMTDSNSANNSASVSTTPKAAPVVLSLTGSTICVSPGGNGTITSSTSVSGVNYQLYNSSNVAVQTAKAGTGSGLTWSGLAAGTGYYVTGTNSDGCNSKSTAVNVSTTANPVALTLTGSTICVLPGGNGTITSSTSVSGTNYQLYNSSNVAVQTVKAGTGSGLTWSGLSAGTGYYVVSTNAANCTANSNTTDVLTTPNPVALSLTGSTICVSPGGNGTITSSTSVSGVNYQLYNSANAAVQTAKTGTGSGLTWSGLTAGTGYYVISTNSATCTSTSNLANVATTPNPVALSLTGSTICIPANGGSITSSTSVSGVNYQLYNSSNVTVQTAKAGTGSGLTWSGISAGTGYYVISTNASSCNANSNNVTIVADTQKPTITCPTNVTKTTDANSCTATGVALGTPTTADNCGVASVTNNAPTSYPIGVTTVTWTVTDNSGNTQTCTQTVTISDAQKPTITCPSNVTKTTDANSCTATGVALGTPTTADNCGVASVTNNAPTSYPIGVTTVTWTVTDNSGNTQTCTQTVTISDIQKPTITCPANVTKTTDANSCTATGVALGTPTTADNCGVASVTNNAPTSYPIGVTTVTWTVTDNSGNTQTCTQTVKIVGPIVAKDDTVTSFNGYTGGTAFTTVLNNDLLNCSAVNASDVTITLASTLPSVLNFNTTSGLVTVNANTPSGVYTFNYTICEKLNPTNCSTATVSISVSAPVIDAVTETTTAINGNVGGTTASLTANDTLNGTPVVIGTNPGQIKLTAITVPTGLTLNANGTVSVAANTPAGNYNVEYSICEITNPTNCDTVTSVVVVSAATIDAVTETTTAINGNVGGTTAALTVNDTLNGTPVVIGTNPGQIKLTAITVPTGLTLNANGTVSIAANTPAGNYNVEYSICEITNPTNCDTVTSVVVVSAATIDAVTETTTAINGNAGGTTATLTANDTLNGTPVVIGTNPGQIKLTGITVPTGLTLNANGTVSVAANTPAGNYNVEYSICEITNPTNCDTVTSVVVVNAATIDAVTETTTAINGNVGGTTAALTANDTLNGTPVVIGTNPGQIKLTAITVPTGLTLNANGTVSVAANTPAGNYNVEYSICEITNPTNCDTVTSVVVVNAATIDAVTETTTAINGNVGGTTAALTANDTLNGTPVVIGTNPGQIKLTAITVPTGLTLNANGTVSVAANTPAGNYNVEYSICEITNPTNCDTVTSVVVVNAATIDAVTETTTAINGNVGGTTAALTANDTLNGTPVVIGTNPGQIKLTAITVPTGLTLNANGTVSVAANTPAGNYNVEYSICEITNPTNCDTVTSIVVVNAATIDAVTETTTAINGNAGGTTAALTTNDTFNGTPVVIGTNPGQIKLTAITVPTGLTLNANGTVSVAANTPAGNYNVEYSICEITNPTNCDTVTSVVVVNAATIDAVTETTTAINGNVGGTTAALTANDTLNGTPVVIGTNPGQIKLTAITVPTGLTLNANGTVSVAANTPAGNYNVEYSICEITNPTNCDTVTSIVVVNAATIDAVTETTTAINGNVGGTTAALTTNDTLNGTPVVIGTNPGQIKLTAITVPTGLTLNANGTVSVAANTPAGNYNVEYSICEITNPTNCDTVTSVVVVNAATIDAVTETTTAINGNVGGTTAALTANDTLNGTPVVIGTNPGQIKLTAITVPTGLTLNANGTVSVAANTPAGNYNVEYSICEITNPTNCDTVTSIVVVNAATIDAVTETTTAINGNVGGTTAALTANDTLNGTPVVIGTNPGQIKLTAITVPTGLTLNANGTVSVAANTPAGNYNVEYSICEITNPTNCDTVTSIVVVNAATIDAVTETTTAINGNVGGTTAALTTNDTLNGTPVVIGTNPGQIKLTAITVPTGLTLNANGTVSVAANTPAGNYNVEYSICEITNPTNCDTVTSIVVVNAATIDAVTETTTAINGNVGGTTAALTTNDTLNGTPVVIGTNPGQIKLTAITVPTGLTLNANGTVSVAANTPAGNYNVEYSICEITNPTNCDTVTSVVVVNAATIDAVTETTTAINGNVGGTTAALTANDTLNGTPVVIGTNPGQIKLTAITVPTGLTLNANGTVSVAANTPAGNYNVEYSICEITNPTNCDTVTSIVVVNAATIDAVTETTTAINGNVGGTTAALTANDTLNGTPVVIGTNPGQIKLTAITVPTGLTLNANGTVSVAANTPAGNYNVEYSICEITNPTNCDTVTSVVVVSAGTLVANADTVPSLTATNTSQTLVNVFDNDTKNGTALVPSDVNLTVTTADPTGYLTIDTNGNAVLGANAPAGNYELTYTICEKLNPTNCSSNTVKVTVGLSTIDAVTETTTAINGNVGGTTAALTANDTLNGNPVVIGTNPGQIKLTAITVPTGLTLNANGTVSVAANTPAGNYNVEYSICEITNPTNCDTVTSVVVVSAGTLVANADTVPSLTATNSPQTLVNVFDNDTKNGTALVPSDVNLTVTTADPTGYLTVDTNGNAVLGANAPAGNYELTYTICEKLNPTNCSSNTVKVTVGLSTIDAVTETTASINGNLGGKTTVSLTANDTLNGTPVVIGTNPGQIKLTGITVPTGLTLNANGTVTVAANTPAGNYNVEYSICEITNPTNCDTVTSVVVVSAGTLVANADTVPSVVATNASQTLVNVFDNDTKNGTALVPSDVNLTVTTADPTGYLTIDTNGNAVLGANAPAGNYELTYTICEKLNPTNCSSNTVKVTVGLSTIDAVTETTTAINGNVGGTTAALTANDTLNGNPVVIGTNPGQIKLTAITVPTGLTLNANGTVSVAANTPAGNYNVEYSICEITNPTNCDTVTSVVVVNAATIDAVTETTASINGNTGGTTAVSLTANDTLNGTPVIIGTNPGQIKLTGITVPTGLTLNANGTVTVAANTPAGNYNVEYSICEITNPTNCDTVTSVVVVSAGTLVANADTVPSLTATNAPQTLVNVFDNDTKNGTALVPSDVNFTVTTADPTGYLTVDTNGNAVLGANAPAGNYELTYTICEKLNPTNCSSNTVKVTVGLSTIDAVTETTASINGNTGGTTTVSLTANDTLNGTPVVIGTNPGQIKLTGITVPTGLTLNANGTVAVAANTPAGNYNVEYSICEITNPTNCDTVTSVVVVSAATIDAVTETTTAINGNVGGTTAALTANDTLNGTPVVIGTNPGQIKLTGITVPTGLTLNANGTVAVAANTPAGNYNVEYSICEITNPTNCDTVTSVVVVNAATIDAVTETTTAINGNVGGTTAALTANDTLNGTPVVIGTNPGQIKLTAITVPTGLTLNANGTVSVAANTPAGNYNVEYSICEITNPTNCDTVTSVVVVSAGTLVANADTVPSLTATNASQTLVNVFDNDTKNGTALVPSDVNLTVTTADPTGYLTVDVNGNAVLGANAPAGNYELTYTICEKLNPTNCSSNTVKVTVGLSTIDAVTETTTAINGNVGGTTAALTANDTLNGTPVVIGTNPGQIKLTGITVPTGLTLNANGTVSVAANTPAGNYNVEYSICEITNPTNCDTVTSVVVVSAGTLVANADTVPSLTATNTSQTLVNVFDNDTKNGTALVPSDVNLTVTTADPTGYLTIDTNGNAVLGANAPAGNYELTYTICEKLNPTNCSSNTVKVTVGLSTIDAVTETTTAINGNVGGTTASLTANDTLNGTSVVIGTNPGQIKLTGITVPTGLTLNANGTVSVAANTPAGNYNVKYSICEITNPTNCDTVTSVVVVNTGTLIANADTVPSLVATNAPQTLVNVFDNDTKNGTALVPSDVNLTVTIADPTGYLTVDANGNAVLGANAPAGNYELTYTICEKLNPTNCSSNTVKVTVSIPTIDAVTETTASINGNTGGTTAALTANDTLNGNPVVIGTNPGQIKLTAITVPTGLTLNANGTVTVAANTPAGNYNVEYSICEITNPTNCDTVTSVVVVNTGTLVANADTVPSLVATNTPQTLVNVFDNDTKNGTALVPSDVNLTVTIADPTGYLTVDTNGNAVLGANAPAGNYELTYTICEKLNPTNCSSNTVKVTVGLSTIDAVTETTIAINGNVGGTTAALTANDTLNGTPVVIGTNPGQIKLTAITVPTELTLNANGTVTVAANTPAGNYNVEYSICEITNPTNCDTVTSVVVVNTGTLVANADTVPSLVATNTPQTLVNVFDNDTKNGTALVPSDVNLTVTIADPTGYLTVDTNGNAVLGANAPAGNYELTYTICEKLNPTNCSSNTVKVTVSIPTIDAVTETTIAINGNVGGTTAALTANDTLNGTPVVIGTNPGQIKLTGITVPTGLTLNANGTVTVVANTPAGNYNVEYSICEITNPTNCDTVTSVVVVSAGTLVANADTVPSLVATNTPQTLVNVFDNDTKNGTALVPSDVNLTVTIADPKGYLTVDTNGNAVLGANAPAGTYELTYTICEKLNPTNCSSNTVKVTVSIPTIDAVTETTASINGNTGGTITVSLTANDTLNGNPVVIGTNPGEVKLTGITVPTGLTLNANGTVTVAANTPAGNYEVEYSICEITNPTNCDTVKSIVVVAGSSLQANDDIFGSAVGINQPITLLNVFNNDTKNGVALVPSDVNLTVTTTDPTGYLTVDTNGNAILGANAPAGNYELIYTICEKLNPTICSSASVKVTVAAPTMTITANSYCSNNVPYVNYNVVADNFTPTGLLTIKWIDSANNVVATQTNLPLNGNILWPGAVVDGSGNGVDWPGWILANGQWTEGADGFENTKRQVTMQFSLNPTQDVIVEYPAPTVGCNAQPTFTIKANNDTAGPIDATKTTSTSINVFDNDTFNGLPINPANTILSTVVPNANLILNADGTVTIKTGTPSGSYELTYQICDISNSGNCSQAIVKVTVLNSVTPVTPMAPIVANNDGEVAVDGINGSLEFINILDNDLLNGLPVNANDVIITKISGNANFEFNPDGTVNVLPNTPGGSYTLTYQICEKAVPTNCSNTATVTVFVEVPAIAIIKTAVFNDENNNQNANAGETITYKFKITNTGNVPLKNITITDPLAGIVLSGQAIDLDVNESDEHTFTAQYIIKQSDINLGSVTNQATVQGTSQRGVVVDDKSDDKDNSGDNATVTTLSGCIIKVFNAFSPNGDSKNTRFYIQGLECYPDNTVEIYNRWGVLVYDADHYNNEDRAFKGYSEGRTTVKQSDGLPVGTYFYILKYKDSGSNPHELTGYLYINK